MHKKLVFFLIAGVLFANMSWALTWDFSTGANDWETFTGNWEVKDGEYIQTDVNTPAMRAMAGDVSWTNYTVEADIKITQTSYAGLIFRAQSDLEYYVFYMNVSENVVELWKHDSGGPTSRTQIFKHAPAEGINIELDEWYHFKVVAEDEAFQCYINDELQDEVVDDTYLEGRIGVWCWNTAIVADNVVVEGPGIPSNAPVEPADKLAASWGKIKLSK